MTIKDPKAFSATVSANLDRLLHEATDPFYSAKYPVEFAFGSGHPIDEERYRGFLIRGETANAQIAVEPLVRAQIAARRHSEFDNLDADARARINGFPVRADGLIHLQLMATMVTRKLPLDA